MGFQTPPARASIVSVTVVKPGGPHHGATRAAEVKAAKTCSRGNAKSREETILEGEAGAAVGGGAGMAWVRWVGAQRRGSGAGRGMTED